MNTLFESTFPGPETALSPRAASLDRPDQPPIEFLWASEPEAVEDAGGTKPSAHARRTLEASWLARRLRQRLDEGWKIRDRATGAVRDAHPGDVAYLFRAMTDVGPYEAALDDEGFDYHTVGGAAFYAQQEVTDFINVLSTIEDPFDQVALAGALRSPFFCLSDDGLYWLTTSRAELSGGLEDAHRIDDLSDLDRQHACRARELLARWRGFKDHEPIAALLDRILDESGYEAALLGESLGARKRANARKLVRLARQFDLQRGLTLAAFVAKLRTDLKRPPREEQASTTDEEGTSVRLMSIHQAKGLEFPIVVLPDLNRKPPGRLDSTAFHARLGPLVRPSRDPGASPAAPEPAGETSVRQSLGWIAYTTLEEREEREESLRLFYVATTRARDALILSAAMGAGDRTASPALELLDERFDRETGLCQVPLPDGWKVPSIRVTREVPAGSRPARTGYSWRLPLIETAEVIEQTLEVVEEPSFGLVRRPRFVDLGPNLEDASSEERLAGLLRAALADPRFVRVKDFPKFAAHLVSQHDPRTSPRIQGWLVNVLEGCSRGLLRSVLTGHTVVAHDLDWTLVWPPEGPDATVFHGKIDVLLRDLDGHGLVLNVMAAGTAARHERLRLLLGLQAADAMGFGPIRQGVALRADDSEMRLLEDRFDPATIDQAVRNSLAEGSTA